MTFYILLTGYLSLIYYTIESRVFACKQQIRKMNKLNIIIVDDCDYIRISLGIKLGECPDLKIIGEAANGKRAVELTQELKPDVIIMDVAMPVMNGIEATRQIINEFPDTKVIGLSMHSDKKFVKEMLKAGAKGYLLKGCITVEELRKAILAVTAGKTYINSGISLR